MAGLAEILGADRLSELFVQYRDKPFAAVHVFDIESVTGWAASETMEI